MPAGVTHEVPRHRDNGASLRGHSTHGDASAATKLQKTLVTQCPKAPEHGVVIDTEHRGQIPSRRQALARYHTSGPRVRTWLVEAGIPVAPRTTRATRIDLPAEALEVLHVEVGMSMREVAAELDMRPAKVRRALHDHGIPVRPMRGRRVPAVRLIEQLYADPEVTRWLMKYQVPARPEPGTVSERFRSPSL